MADLFRKSYRYAEDSNPNEEGVRSARILKDTKNFVVHTPTTKNQGTSFVLLPYMDGAQPAPERFTTRPSDITPWLFTPEGGGVSYVGVTKKITFFFAPVEPGFRLYDDHPYYLLRSAAWAAKDKLIRTPVGDSSTDNWFGLVERPKNNDNNNYKAKLPKPTMLTVGLALIYAHDDKMFWGPGKAPQGGAANEPLRVLLMSQDARNAFFSEYNKTSSGRIIAEDDFKGLANYPVVGSKFVHLYDKNKQPQVLLNHMRTQAMLAGSPAPVWGRQGFVTNQNQGFGYAALITDTVDGNMDCPVRISMQELQAQGVLAKIRDWNDIVYGHDIKECAEVLGNELGFPLSLLHEAWKGHKEWYPEELIFALKNPVSSAPPPAPPPSLPSPTGAPRSAPPVNGGFPEFVGQPEPQYWGGYQHVQQPMPRPHHQTPPQLEPQSSGGGWYGMPQAQSQPQSQPQQLPVETGMPGGFNGLGQDPTSVIDPAAHAAAMEALKASQAQMFASDPAALARAQARRQQ